MPELPEVEVIKIGLQKRIIGLKIQKIQILSQKSFIGNPDLVEGLKVMKVWRKAKMLGIDLGEDKQLTLLFHLKMSGQLIYIPNDKRLTINDQRFIGGHPTPDMLGKMPNSHTRVIFTLQNQETRDKNQESSERNPRLSTLATSHLYFNDQRKFGWVKATRSVILSEAKDLINLGSEPLEKEFTWQILKQNLLKHKNLSVKVALMDQSIVSGVGNIYSNEACFLAKIDPKTKIAALIDKQFQALHQGIIKALQAGIKHGGSTGAHFVDPEGRKGYFLDYAFVYGWDKLPCKVCGTTIKKISLGGRGTYFCEHCQK